MAVTWRYVATDLRTGANVGALPLHDVSFSEVLNGAGRFQARLRLPVDRPDVAAALIDATTPTRRAVYVERGDRIWGFVIWDRSYDTDTQDLTLSGAELWSYFAARRIRWGAKYGGEFGDEDQFHIARDLIRTAQAQPGGNIRVRLGSGLSGVGRTVVYRPWEDKLLAEEIEQLAGLSDGFDFWIEVRRTGTAFSRRLRLAYPQRGRGSAESGLVWILGTNMMGFEWPEKGSAMATSVVAYGSGSGSDVRRIQATDTMGIAAGWPLLDASVNYKDARRPAILEGHARAELASRNTPVINPTATVLADDDPQVGSYEPGDYARFLVLPGSEPRWPSGLSVDLRIIAVEVRPPDDGEPETVKLTLGQVVEYEEGTAIPVVGLQASQAFWGDEPALWGGLPVIWGPP